MGLREDLSSAMGATLAEAVRSVVNGKYILGYGIVEEVMADGVVMVSPSALTHKSEYVACPCILGTMSSDAITVNVVPKVKDKVLVFYPRRYDHKMFSKESDGAIINRSDFGYSPYTGIAFLFNQFQESQHFNWATIDSGTIDAHLAYDEGQSDEEVKVNNLHLALSGNGSVESHHKYLKDDEVYNVNKALDAEGAKESAQYKYLSDDEAYNVTKELDAETALETEQYKYLSDDEVYNIVKTVDGETGSVKLECKYVGDDSVYNTVIALDGETGDITIQTGDDGGEYNSTFTIKGDGNLSFTNPKATLGITEEGALSFENEKATVSVTDGGDISLANEKVEISATNDGEFTVTADGTTVTYKKGEITLDDGTNSFKMGSSGVEMSDGQGKVSISSGKVTLQGLMGKVEVS